MSSLDVMVGSQFFSKAEKINRDLGTHLGTLAYIPWDIRLRIYKNVIIDQFGWVTWSNRSPRPLLPPWYRLGCHESTINLKGSTLTLTFVGDGFPLNISFDIRLASVTLRDEFDSVLLSLLPFKFACPCGLSRLLT